MDLFIVGAQKAGTTSLKNYLGEHPQIITHSSQEFPYFFDKNEYQLGFNKIYNQYFNQVNETTFKVVCKHAHLYTSEIGLQRLSKDFPNVSLIFILRNPVDRAYSSYLMEKLYNRVNFNFDEIPESINGSSKLKLETWQFEALISFGFYSFHLKNIYKYFEKEKVRLILFEDFKNNPLFYLKNIFSELDVQKNFNPRVREIHNESSVPRSLLFSGLIKNTLIEENKFKSIIKKVLPGNSALRLGTQLRDINKKKVQKKLMNESTRAFLTEYFKPYNEELSEITNLDLSSWN
ncbi:MAG: sulfotransferase family protein [Bacteroidota bacterium]